MFFSLFFWLFFFLLFPTQGAFADVLTPIGSVRSLSMGGAYRGLGGSAEALSLNPAGMALHKRYGIDVQYAYQSDTQIHGANATVVDSKTSIIAAGVGYTRIWGNPKSLEPSINRIYLGSAYALGPVAMGFTTQTIQGFENLQNPEEKMPSAGLWDGTASLMVRFAQWLMVGITAENLFHFHGNYLPRTLGLGVGLQMPFFSLAMDIEQISQKNGIPSWQSPFSIHLGGEFILLEYFYLRAGLSRSALPRHLKDMLESPQLVQITLGSGFSNRMLGLQIGYSQPLSKDYFSQWYLTTALQFFI